MVLHLDAAISKRHTNFECGLAVLKFNHIATNGPARVLYLEEFVRATAGAKHVAGLAVAMESNGTTFDPRQGKAFISSSIQPYERYT